MLNIQAVEVEVPLERPTWEKYGGYSSAYKHQHSLLWNIENRQFIPTPLFASNGMACRFYRWLEIKLGEDLADEVLVNPYSGEVDWSDLYGEFMSTPLILKMTFAEPEFETSVDDDTGEEYHHTITFRKHDEDYNDIPPNDSRTFTVEVIPTPIGKRNAKNPVEMRFNLTKKQKASLPKYAKDGIEELKNGDESMFEHHILSASTDWVDEIRKRFQTANNEYNSKVVISISAEIISPEWATKEASKHDLIY